MGKVQNCRAVIGATLVSLLVALTMLGCSPQTDKDGIVYSPNPDGNQFAINYNNADPPRRLTPEDFSGSGDIELDTMTVHLGYFEDTYFGATCRNSADYSPELLEAFLEEGKYIICGMSGDLTVEQAEAIIEEVSQGDYPIHGSYTEKHDFNVSFHADENYKDTFYLCVRDYVSGIDD